MIYLGREKLFGFSVGFGDTLFWQPWQFPWPGWSVSLPVLPCWGHLAEESSEVAPGGGGQSKVWLPWPGWAVPELGPAAQTSRGKPRRALAVPGWHRGTARAGGSRAVQVLSCQPHPQGCPWRSVRLCGSVQPPQQPWRFLEPLAGLPQVCSSWMAPGPVCQWAFPHTNLLLELSVPCTALSPALGTSLDTEPCSAGLLQLPAACPQTCLWRTCFLQGCNDFPALQGSAGHNVWPSGCHTAWVSPCPFPVVRLRAVPPGCRTVLLPASVITAEHSCCHCAGGLGSMQKMPQQPQKTQPYI